MDAGTLVGELKRRRVFRALVGYGVAAFAVLQIVEPLMHGFRWPDEVLSYVVVALAAGFPVVVTLAWIFDIGVSGVERTGPAAAPALRGARLVILLVGIGVLAAAPGLLWYFVIRPSARGVGAEASSIAVLPFVDMSEHRDQEYFGDGLAEELLNLLSKTPGLRVAARTSAFSFKGKSVKVSEIGRELGVATVLEGSVRKSGEQLRVTTQLVSVADGYHLWSETYDRKLTDVFAIQDEIARAVVAALKIKLLPRRPDERGGTSADAYVHYLEGRSLMRGRTMVEYQRALDAFQRALDLDPGFAPAWAGIGYTRSRLAEEVRALPELLAMKRQGLAEIDKGIALAPTVPESYAVRAIVHLRDRFDWARARADFEQALTLAPGDAFTLEQYGYWFQAWRGQFREAEASLRKALESDPLNSVAWHWLGCVHLFAGELAPARQAFDREHQISAGAMPDDGWPIYLLIAEGRPAEALEAASHAEVEAWRLAGAALAHHALGHERQSRAALADLSSRMAAEYSVQVAQVHAFRGETDSAFLWLDRAYDNRDPGMMRLKVDPLLRTLRGDPRYAALLAKIGLPAD